MKEQRKESRTKRFFKIFGPGVVAGAADDDPSGIATYTQAGAQFGYGQLWTAILILPFLTAVQEACARIGAVTGKGLAAAIKAHYSPRLLYFAVALVLVANTINIGADLGAMGAAAQLLLPQVDFAALTIFFTAVILLLEIFVSYKSYARILKWLALALLAYPITVFLVEQPWPEILRATFVPNIQLDFGFLFIITAVLGTTISPYLFFWEASGEVEEERAQHLIKDGVPRVSRKFMEPLVNTFPTSGFLAQLVFAFGVIGLGFLAVPVLSGSAAYALSETLKWREGLNLKFKRAHGFYGIIAAATLIGLLMNFIGIDPIKALIFAAVFNGVAAVPLIFMIARLAQRRDVMGDHVSGSLSRTLLLLTFGLIAAAAVAMFYTLWKG